MLRSKWWWIGLAALAVTTFCAVANNGLDLAVAERLRSLPKIWNTAGKFFSSWAKGENYMVPAGVVGMVIFWFWRRHLGRFYYALFAVLATGGIGLLNTGVKYIFGRARPPRVWPDAGYDYGFHFFQGTKAAWQSFPSGHSICAAVSATVLWFVLPRWARPCCVLYVLVMMASRLLATAHFLSDVVAGAFLGMVFALAIRDWMRKRQLF